MKQLLKGAYDMHVHAGPDVIERKMDDLELAAAYKGTRKRPPKAGRHPRGVAACQGLFGNAEAVCRLRRLF